MLASNGIEFSSRMSVACQVPMDGYAWLWMPMAGYGWQWMAMALVPSAQIMELQSAHGSCARKTVSAADLVHTVHVAKGSGNGEMG